MSAHDPGEMSDAFKARLRAMPSLQRDRVLERACILHAQGGRTWRECDALAAEMERMQPGLFGGGT